MTTAVHNTYNNYAYCYINIDFFIKIFVNFEVVNIKSKVLNEFFQRLEIIYEILYEFFW